MTTVARSSTHVRGGCRELSASFQLLAAAAQHYDRLVWAAAASDEPTLSRYERRVLVR